MTALHRKLLRDLWHLRGPATAIGLVLACGVATFVMSLCTLETLRRAQSEYYDHYCFADAFVRVKRAPGSLAARLAEIPGVRQVETRIVEQVNLDIPGYSEPATGRLVSIPDHATPRLNQLHLRLGRRPEFERPGEVLVSEGFADAHGLKPGAKVHAILNGRRQDLTIVGIALSPEFIYQIREGDLFPDDKRYGVFWMPRTTLESVFDMDGAFNDAVLSLTPEAVREEVLRRIDNLTEPYGGSGAFDRSEQASHKFVTNELSELRGMALVVPTIFLLVAGFLLQVVVSRLIGTQREQIATLKAFGYRRSEIGTHYFQMIMVMATLGVLVGTIVGARLGISVAAMYTRFFRFPSFGFHLDPRVVLGAAGISLSGAGLATFNAVRRAMALPPAEAMRPEPPAVYGTSWLDSRRLFQRASPAVRMVVRQIARRPLRSGLTCLGIALAVAVLILGSFMVDALDYVIDSEFTVAQRQDMMLTFAEPTVSRTIADVRHLPGVLFVEPFRALPVRLRSQNHSRRMALLGLSPDARLFRIVDRDRNAIPVPRHGIVISANLAQALHVSVGDWLTVEVLEAKRPVVRLQIEALVSDFQGESAYADLSVVNRLMQEGNVVSGVFLMVDSAQIVSLYRQLKETPRVASVSLKGAALTSIRQTIAANILRMRAFNVGFACVIAFGVVYNSARIALAERDRDLATLRVIGFRRGEASGILLGELALLTVAAIPFGLFLGYVLADLVIRIAYDTELFRIPLVIDRWTYAFAATTTLLAAVCSGLIVTRRIGQLDLVAVLKSRE